MSRKDLSGFSDALRTVSTQLKRRLAAETFPEFMTETLELQMPKHMMEWSSLLNKWKALVVQATRDHGKSWLFSYGYPLFKIQRVRNPKEAIHIAFISYSEDQAGKNLARIRKAVESRPPLRWLVPKLKSYTWDTKLLNFSNDCTLEAFGFGSSIRGGHYHLIVIDDPTKDHWTMSVQEQSNFFFGVVLPALRRGGQIVVTGTPVEKNDLLEVLENNAEYKTFKYPCWDEKLKPLWPQQYTLEDLYARQRQMPTHLFAREYLLRRVSAEDAKFKESDIRWYTDADLVDDRTGKIRPLYKIMTIDPAISPGGDALGVSVTGTDSKSNTYVLDRLRFRGDFKNGVSQLCDMIQRNLPDYIGIETFAFQRMYKTWLEEEMQKRGMNQHIEELGNASRKSKAMRIEALQPKLAAGKLFFKEEHKPLVDQFLLWEPLSKHNEDDEIDAMAWQVPLWRGPYDDTPMESSEPVPGSFLAAFEESRRGSYNEGFFGRLFGDLAS